MSLLEESPGTNSATMGRAKKTVILALATHWDREWYQSFQGTRFRLVPTMERIAEGLERDPRITVFHLDGQTSLVEDVREVRPDLASKLKKLIAEGRLLVGPWYTMPDVWLVSAESMLRNLELGIRQATSLGCNHRIGYVCDLFGFHSQVPQLFVQCGVEGAFLFRGTTDQTHPRDFWWVGPERSKVLCHRFSEEGAYCEFFSAVRSVDRARGRLIDLDSATDRAVAFLNAYAAGDDSSVALVSDGADHSDLEPDIAELVGRVNAKLSWGEVRIGTWKEFLVLREETNDLIEITGELREPAAKPNTPNWLISNTLSSHADLKLWNRKVEDLLTRLAEPLTAWLRLHRGHPDRRAFLDVAWKHLLQNHAHDSICGCSIDDVHLDMEYRFRQAQQIAREVINDAGRRCFLEKSANAGDAFSEFLIFNPHPRPVIRTLDVTLHLPPLVAEVDANDVANRRVISGYPHYTNGFFGEAIPQLAVHDAVGRELPHQIHAIEHNVTLREQVDGAFPVVGEFERVVFSFEASLAPLGFTKFRVTPRDRPLRLHGSLAQPPNILENRFLRVALEPAGTIALTDKDTGKTYSGLFYFEDGADFGDGWFHGKPVQDLLVYSGIPTVCSVVQNGPLRAILRLEYVLCVPEELDHNASRRSSRTVQLPVTLELTLEKEARRLDARILVSNCARDHRLRLGFRTGIRTGTGFTSTPGDLVERPFLPPEEARDGKEIITSLPSSGISLIRGEDGFGLAALHPGIYESWFAEDRSGTILLTLFRGFRRTIFTQGEERCQLQRDLEFRLALYPIQPATSEAELFATLDEVALPFETAAGMPGCQVNPTLLNNLLSIDGEFSMTSLRPAGEDSFELRGFNPSDKNAEVLVQFFLPIEKLELTNALGENPSPIPLRDDGTCSIILAGGSFLTLRCRVSLEQLSARPSGR